MLLATLDWHAFFFMLFALLTCAFAVAVLFSNNVVHMAFYLILSLGASAGLFFLAGAEFVGAMQLMILWTWHQHAAPSLPCYIRSYRQYRPGVAPVVTEEREGAA